MAVSGKTAAPWEVPFLLGSDTPDMGAGDRAIAERVHAILAGSAQQSLGWLKSGAEKQIIVCNASGVPQYVTASGDVTNTAAGVFTIGAGKVTQSKLAAEAVNSSKIEDGTVTDADLASPNNSFYRTLLAASQKIASAGLNLYLIANTSGAVINLENLGSAAPPYIYFASADYAVAGKTQKLRVRAQVAVNATKPASKLTVGLYPFTVAGGASEIKLSLGTVVPGSTVAFNEPAASTVSQGSSGDFSIPSDGAYLLGFENSTNFAANSSVLVGVQLQARSV